MLTHAGREVKGNFCFPDRTSFGVTRWTTESSVWRIKRHTWQDESVHSGAFLLAKSEGMFADPARWCTEHWNRLTVDKNVDTRGLAENSPRQSFAKACTQGLLSVRMHVRCLDCTIYGLKYLQAAAIESASISHGSQVTCRPRSLELKKPATCGFPCRVMYSVAPMPRALTAPSVTIQSWSDGRGRVMVRGEAKAPCAVWKDERRSSDHAMRSPD